MGCTSSATVNTAENIPAKTDNTPAKTLISPEAEVKPAADSENKSKVSSARVVELLNREFDLLDRDQNGFISKEELSIRLDNVLDCSPVEHVVSSVPIRIGCKSLRTLLAETSLNPYVNLFEQLDTNQDGKISREEFQAQMHPAKASKTVEQILKQFFDRIDANGDGNISREEFSAAFERLLTCSDRHSRKNFKTLMVDAGMNPDFFAFEQLDANSDGKVTWEEFSSKLMPAFDFMDFLKKVFNQLDANGDGHVSKEELSSSFEQVLSCNDIKSKKSFRTLVAEAGLKTDFHVFDHLDTNHDGRITWDEFEANLRPATSKPVTEQPEPVTEQAAAEPATFGQDVDTSAKGIADPVTIEDESAAKSTICCI